MQPVHAMKRLPALECLDDIEQLVRRSLRGNWVIRVEYADAGQGANWRTWGKPLFAVRDTGAIIDAVLACRASHPTQAIRLNAERFHPDTRLLYWIHPPKQNQPTVVNTPAATHVAFDTADGTVKGLGAGARFLRRGVWRALAVAGMLIASLLVFEGSVFA